MTGYVPNGRPCEGCGGKVVVHVHSQEHTGPIIPPIASLLICPACDPPCGWCLAENAH
jgi:hypothetical protein